MTEEKMIRTLIREALAMRKVSYAPYSGFCVGAALLTREGRIFTGCNIENAAYGATMCAERTAMFKAVSEGCRDFETLVIVGGPAAEEPKTICPPCGTCRQVMSEFADEDFRVIFAVSEEEYEIYTMKEILPLSFEL